MSYLRVLAIYFETKASFSGRADFERILDRDLDTRCKNLDFIKFSVLAILLEQSITGKKSAYLAFDCKIEFSRPKLALQQLKFRCGLPTY